MAGWESLRVDLLRLREESPDALVMFPTPETERRSERRFRIELAAWATDIAATMKATYGDLVDLRVGAMLFPARELWAGEVARQLPAPPAEAVGLHVEIVSPLSVQTGRSAHREVLVTNRTDREQVLFTMGELDSMVTDSSGAVVGRYVGPRHAKRVGFPAEARQSRAMPVLIGTASMVPDLGYAVPPGRWGLVIAVHTDEGHMRSAPLEITITP